MLALKGHQSEGIEVMANSWRVKQAGAEKEVQKCERNHKNLARRYKAAVDRLSRARVIPQDIELEKIQRYQTHLERVLHKALERLQSLQEARTAVPLTINLAVVQGGYRDPELASFGNSAIRDVD